MTPPYFYKISVLTMGSTLLSRMVGTTDLFTGALLIVSSFFISQDFMIVAIMLAAFAHVGIVAYANVKMVDK